MTVREALLADATRPVATNRAEDYGDVHANFGKIARLWRDTFGWDAAASDVALAMVLVKVARITANPAHWDSWTDIAGYAALGAEVAGCEIPWSAHA